VPILVTSHPKFPPKRPVTKLNRGGALSEGLGLFEGERMNAEHVEARRGVLTIDVDQFERGPLPHAIDAAAGRSDRLGDRRRCPNRSVTEIFRETSCPVSIRSHSIRWKR
jgi:hypothetical protein